MLTALLVMVGGALGAPARFWLDAAVGRRLPAALRAGSANELRPGSANGDGLRRFLTGVPWGTAVVNVGGSLALGAVAAADAAGALGDVGALLGTGVCVGLSPQSRRSASRRRG